MASQRQQEAVWRQHPAACWQDGMKSKQPSQEVKKETPFLGKQEVNVGPGGSGGGEPRRSPAESVEGRRAAAAGQEIESRRKER